MATGTIQHHLALLGPATSKFTCTLIDPVYRTNAFTTFIGGGTGGHVVLSFFQRQMHPFVSLSNSAVNNEPSRRITPERDACSACEGDFMLESYSPSSATSSVEAWDVPQAPPPGFHKDALPGSNRAPSLNTFSILLSLPRS